MNDDLVKRLQNAPADGLGTENLCLEAADRIEELEAEQADLVRAGLEAAADRIHAELAKIQPEMTRRAQRLAEGKRPGFQYAIHRADLDAKISIRDKIRALSADPEAIAAIVARTLTK